MPWGCDVTASFQADQSLSQVSGNFVVGGIQYVCRSNSADLSGGLRAGSGIPGGKDWIQNNSGFRNPHEWIVVWKSVPALGGQVGRGKLRTNQEGRSTVTQMGKTQLGLPRDASTRGLQAGNIYPGECAQWFIGANKRNTGTALYICFHLILLKNILLCMR